MKDASTSEQPTGEVPTGEQQASTIAVSRRSRRAAERDTPDTDRSEPESDSSSQDGAQKRHGFRHWTRQRPFISGLLVVLGGIELFFSTQLDTGNLQIQFGIEGFQATVIPIALVVLALLAIFKPTHHMFYGIIALVLAVYSLIGVNLGGFIIGMLLSSIGAVLVVAWMGPRGPKSDIVKPEPEAEESVPESEDADTKDADTKDAGTEAPGSGRREDEESAGEVEES